MLSCQVWNARSMSSRQPSSTRGSEFVGTLVELEITNVAHGGVFVARHEGRVIFVSDTLPGERVIARVSDASQKSFWRADAVEVLQPSEHRRDHVWAAAAIDRDPRGRAGGADYRVRIFCPGRESEPAARGGRFTVAGRSPRDRMPIS